MESHLKYSDIETDEATDEVDMKLVMMLWAS